MAHHDHQGETPSHGDQSYRKKQIPLVILVFVCIVAASVGGSVEIAVGAIAVACGLCFWAARLQPEPTHDEHH